MVNQMPDIMGSVVAFLNDSPDLEGLNIASICPDLTGYVRGQRWVMVHESPGREVIPGRLDAVEIDFNIYAESRPATKSLASSVRAAVLAMRNFSDGDLVVTDVTTLTTPFDMTDLLDKQYRYVFDVTIYFRPY